MERRKFKRSKIDIAGVDYRLMDFSFMAEFCARGSKRLRDISLGGISFNAQDSLPHDSLMHLTLIIGDTIKLGDICGRIVRIRKIDEHTYEIGVRFSWWGREKDKKTMVKLLENN